MTRQIRGGLQNRYNVSRVTSSYEGRGGGLKIGKKMRHNMIFEQPLMKHLAEQSRTP